ncbi:ATP-dependent DNA helicase CHL1 [Humulus lupulus]|uniref:ATP-dependent DNA helicase CHL1 n=1 Tax=Humulus lupulus TaxID=3486 RepID=UPI002B405F37|nr:ATP-dependent DNA helicase CHL1 [Humulus lupulus]
MSSINITSPHCRCNSSSGSNHGLWKYLDIKGSLLVHSYSYSYNKNVSFATTSTSNNNNRLIFSTRAALDNTISPDEDDSSEDDDDDDEESADSTKPNSEKLNYGTQESSSKSIRDNLERIVGKDDSAFSGLDLATLIRNKYGKSYDVQLIKKEFMGRNLLAMNVMWKYMEQRSFPLTEEEYILRLDDVANNLKCWGAVSHIRNSLQNSKERPRIGKAVSIFIDMDESGGRANEWIYK